MSIRSWYRYWFVRKRSPLSYIWWCSVLRRAVESHGMYRINIASRDEPDCALQLSCGAPQDNCIVVCIYDEDNTLFDTVKIKLNYRDARRVIDGFSKAFAISRNKMREEEQKKVVK